MTHPTVAELRPIDLFDGLSDAELGDVAAVATIREHAPGETIADHRTGEQAVYLLLDGTGEALNTVGDREDPAGDHVSPTWIGAIAVVIAIALQHHHAGGCLHHMVVAAAIGPRPALSPG